MFVCVKSINKFPFLWAFNSHSQLYVVCNCADYCNSNELTSKANMATKKGQLILISQLHFQTYNHTWPLNSSWQTYLMKCERYIFHSFLHARLLQLLSDCYSEFVSFTQRPDPTIEKSVYIYTIYKKPKSSLNQARK